jgi:Ca2+-binding RTX toxin-like protein
MFLINRKALAAIGVTAAAVATTTTLLASPAQAASGSIAKVVGTNTVQFNALLGKANSLVITISGRTVTLDDKVALKPGKGCKKVDSTKVKCTTSKKTTKLSVALGDKNDSVTNKTGVYMLADGGSGNDTLIGGSGADQLQGSTGIDKLYGKAGNDILFGDAGNDWIDAAAGNDTVLGGAGNDVVYGKDGKDVLYGEAGNDTISAGNGGGSIVGGTGNDRLVGGNGIDSIFGDNLDGTGTGVDVITAGAGNDLVVAGPGNDSVDTGAGADDAFGKAGNDTIAGGSEDDILIGEDATAGGVLIGSDTALDVLDGGTEASVTGDTCLVMAAGTTINCESTNQATSASSFAARSSADIAAAVEAQERAIAALRK